MPPAGLTTTSSYALFVAGAAALINWASVTFDRRQVEWITKPLVMIALIVAAVTLQPADPTIRIWVVIGLACSLAGDVFLMLPKERFIEGLASFFVAHLAYIVAFVLAADSFVGAAIGALIASVALAIIGRPIIDAVRRDEPKLATPVVGYMGVISAMVVAACATAAPWSIAGAGFFFASDGVLATNKFVRPIPMGRFMIMSTYHLAQMAFVVALVR